MKADDQPPLVFGFPVLEPIDDQPELIRCIQNGFLDKTRSILLSRRAIVSAEAMHTCVKFRRYRTLKMILFDLPFEAPINSVNSNGIAPIHMATLMNDLDMLRLFFLHSFQHSGLEPVNINVTDHMGRVGLHLAAIKGLKEVCTFYYLNAPESVKAVDNEGDTALHHAAREGHLEICKLLCSEFDPSIMNIDGNNAFDIALEYERIDVCKMLMDRLSPGYVDDLLEEAADKNSEIDLTEIMDLLEVGDIEDLP